MLQIVTVGFGVEGNNRWMCVRGVGIAGRGESQRAGGRGDGWIRDKTNGFVFETSDEIDMLRMSCVRTGSVRLIVINIICTYIHT